MKLRTIKIVGLVFLFSVGVGFEIYPEKAEAACQKRVGCVTVECHYDLGWGKWWKITAVIDGSQECATDVYTKFSSLCGTRWISAEIDECDANDGRVGRPMLSTMAC